MKRDSVIKIAGAGIAGLTAAINLAKAGVEVEVHEKRSDVGMRFGGDIQGLENWTTDEDALLFLQAVNVKMDFTWKPIRKTTFFDDRLEPHRISVPAPLVYLLRRGSQQNTLDQSLKRQALEAGAKIIFNSALHPKRDGSVDIVATGPSRATVIFSGYSFRADAEDAVDSMYDNSVAPEGYAYLATLGGYGIVGSVIFRNFRAAKQYRDRATRRFMQVRPLKIHDVKPCGGYGTVGFAPRRRQFYIGEAGGFQDMLWGFGMRFALKTGYLAARSILDGSDFHSAVRRGVTPRVRQGILARQLFRRLGNPGYRVLGRVLAASKDTRRLVRRLYAPGPHTWIAAMLGRPIQP